MKQQFKIWHLFLVTAIVAIVVFWSFPPELFPYESVEDAGRVNHFHYELREKLGDFEGPFKHKGSTVLNRHIAPNRKIRYMNDGSVERYVIPESLDGIELKAMFFENRKRNNLVLLYARQPD